MFALFRALLLAAGLTLLLAIVEPWAELALYTSRLALRPVPEEFFVPVDGVNREALRDAWHLPRPGGRRHEGIDIFAPQLTTVRSTTEGVVARVGTNQLGGHVVWVVGPGRQRHYYAHLARAADLVAGQRVHPGTPLGFVGTSGNARGGRPHLHYGIYTAQGAINPFPLLARRPRSEGA